MHPKYLKLLDPAYLQYAQEVEANPPFDGNNISSHREMYNQNHRRHYSEIYDHIVLNDHQLHTRDDQTIALRSYTPPNAEPGKISLYLHGGGWVLGNLETHDDICMDIALNTSTMVVAVDYRLAPEYPFPQPLRDCIDAIKAIQNGEIAEPGVPTSLVIGGDSAGANLSVAACLSTEIDLQIVSGLVLIYPGLGADNSLPSFRINEFAPILPNSVLEVFFKAYMGGDISKATALSSPLLADDISFLPPCFISAAEHDPLKDDALIFCQKLDKQQVYCRLSLEKDLGHGYLRVRHDSQSARQAFQESCQAIVEMHGKSFVPVD